MSRSLGSLELGLDLTLLARHLELGLRVVHVLLARLLGKQLHLLLERQLLALHLVDVVLVHEHARLLLLQPLVHVDLVGADDAGRVGHLEFQLNL